jgi:hypothetical protein
VTKSEASEKIKKLLNNKGRTEAESDTAQIIAAALAEKHGIDIAALDVEDERNRVEITHRTFGEWTSIPCEADYAALICEEHFEVSTIALNGWTEKKVFVGTEWHLQIAEYIFNFLIKEFRWQWNKKRGRCKKRKLFMWGCYIALSRKLQAQFARTNPSTALEISFKAKRADYMKGQWPKSTKGIVSPEQKKGAALHRGWMAGKDIEIRPGVKGGDQNQQAQLGFENSRLLTNGD